MGQIFARDLEPVGMIVVPGCQDDGAPVMNRAAAVLRPRLDREHRSILSAGIPACDRNDLLVQRDPQLVCVTDPPIVPQSLRTGRLLVRRGKRDGTDLQQLGCGKKHHIAGEMKDRIHQYSLFKHLVIQSRLLGRNSGRQARRSSPDNNEIE